MAKSPDFSFSRILLNWDKKKNRRQMPWKGEKDPYRIWLSEIILQQTRVEQGLKYYQRFLKRFPTVNHLAKAKDTTVYKQWEGLGYYSRCHNLLVTARKVANELNGKFPATFEGLIKLKGVGNYTASAISSFAYNQPHAVVDGNVIRLLARIFGINERPDTSNGKKEFERLAELLLDKKKPASYNQAIMDFGATVCKPVPDCDNCPFNSVCRAYVEHRVLELPVKKKKSAIQNRWFYYIVPEYNGKIGIHQRNGKDIWQNLFQFLLVESKRKSGDRFVLMQAERKNILKKGCYRLVASSENYKQQLSHQFIQGKFLRVELSESHIQPETITWITVNQLKKFPFPNFINRYIDDALKN